MPKAGNGRKVCSKCREEKSVSEFHKSTSRADGLCYPCKSCRASAHKVRYEANREARLAHSKEYSTTEAGKVVHQVASRHYRQSDKGQVTYSKASAKRRALKAGTISDLSSENFAILDAQHPVCTYCGHAFEAEGPFKRTLDHIVPFSRGGQHTLDNVVFACSRCNSQKSNRLPEEWIHRWYESGRERGQHAFNC